MRCLRVRSRRLTQSQYRLRIDLASVLPYDDFTDLLQESADGGLIQTCSMSD